MGFKKHKKQKTIYWAVLVLVVFAFLFSPPSQAQHVEFQKDMPVVFQADVLKYDQENDVLVATGNVEIIRDGQVLFADEITYSKTKDISRAKGNVKIIGRNGETYFADEDELSDGLKNGFAKNMSAVLADGSRFAAQSGERRNGTQVIINDGVYSPCNLCKKDTTKAPLWQLRANRIIQDSERQDIYYHNARLEFFGVPVAYTPFLSHPDPSVERRTGLLRPEFGFDTKLGVNIRNEYYTDIAPDKDATLQLVNTSRQGTVLGGQWRQRFVNGEINIQGSANRSTVRGGPDDETILREKGFRGHLFADGEFHLNEKWRAGFDIKRTVDDLYLEDFNYSLEDVLTNEIYAERFDGRNYSNASLLYFQDLRPDINEEQPDLFPRIQHNAVGTPNGTFGGRWALGSEFINLQRDGEQFVSRLSFSPSWERSDVTPQGFKITTEARLQNDNYWVRDLAPLDQPNTSEDNDAVRARFFPSATVKTSYPLVKPLKKSQILIEPKLSLTVSPNQSVDDDLPNEDSRDIQLDVNNLFDSNRFPGRDRVESGTHAAYGLKTGLYDTSRGNSAFITVGQSYRFTDNNDLFPDGSGLEGKRSDYVGQVEVTFADDYFLDYRFQVDEDGFDGVRHELQAVASSDQYTLRTAYLFANEVEGTGIAEDRQQFQIEGLTNISDTWSVFGNTIQDLSGDAGLLEIGGGIQYKNECLRLTLRGERDLTDRSTGGAENSVTFSIGLRNLGGFDINPLQPDQIFSAFEDR